VLSVRRLLLLPLLLVGCHKPADVPIARATSSDGWTAVVSVRHQPPTVGTNSLVVHVQTDMHANVVPGDVNPKMVIAAAHPTPSSTPPPVELQPDGEPGHWLAIFDMPHVDTWHATRTVAKGNAVQTFTFDLKN
jgi:hypothetical protein